MKRTTFEKAWALQSELYDIERQIKSVVSGDVIQISIYFKDCVPDIIKEAVSKANAKYLEYLKLRKAELEKEFEEL